MAAVVYDRRGHGEPLVLIHGIGGRWQMWEPVLGGLAPHRDVIALDLPGFGASPMPPAGHPGRSRFARPPGGRVPGRARDRAPACGRELARRTDRARDGPPRPRALGHRPVPRRLRQPRREPRRPGQPAPVPCRLPPAGAPGRPACCARGQLGRSLSARQSRTRRGCQPPTPPPISGVWPTRPGLPPRCRRSARWPSPGAPRSRSR